MKKTKKFLSIFAILFVAIFALSCCFFAACGSKDDEKDNDTTTEQGDGDKGSGDTGSGDTGSGDTGSGDTGSGDTGSGDTGSGDTGSGDTGSGDTGSGDSGSGDESITYTEYESVSNLQTAINGAEEGDVLYAKLGGEETTPIVGTLTISANVVLDLNGKTLQNVEDDAGTYEEEKNTITVTEDGSLTILDSSCQEGETTGTGSIKNIYSTTLNGETTTGYSSDSAAVIFTEGSVELESGILDGASVGIRAQAGTVNINGGKITSDFYAIWEDVGEITVTINDGEISGERKGIYVGGDGNFGLENYQTDAKTKLIVNGGSITCNKDSAICTLGYTSVDSAYIEINGGELKSNYMDDTTYGGGDSSTRIPAIYLPGGTLKVTAGEISGATALEVRGGKATIEGGTFETTANGTNTPTYQGSGATSYGYSVAVYPFGETNNRHISDSSFDVSTTVFISDGTFEGGIYGTTDRTYTKDSNTYALDYTLTIVGGTFSDAPSSFIGERCTTTTNESNKTVVTAVQAETVEGLISADSFGATQSGTLTENQTFDNSEHVLCSADDGSVVVSFFGDSSSTKWKTEKNRYSSDGICFENAIQMGSSGLTKKSPTTNQSIKVVTTGACTIALYMVSSGATRALAAWTATGTEGSTTYTQWKEGETEITYAMLADEDGFEPVTIEISAAGTYYFGSTNSSLNFYGMFITYGNGE